MAKRRSRTRTVYRTRTARAAPRRRRSSGIGGFSKKAIVKDLIDGALVGFGNGFVPADTAMGLARPAIPLAVGYVRKNNVLKTLGAISLGGALAEVVGAKVGIKAERWF